eukprot:4108295-Pyramimonas_sp.AAC.1
MALIPLPFPTFRMSSAFREACVAMLGLSARDVGKVPQVASPVSSKRGRYVQATRTTVPCIENCPVGRRGDPNVHASW